MIFCIPTTSRVFIIGYFTSVRAGCGTENTTLAATYMALRHKHQDEFSGNKSFQFVSSTNTVCSSIYVFYLFPATVSFITED